MFVAAIAKKSATPSSFASVGICASGSPRRRRPSCRTEPADERQPAEDAGGRRRGRRSCGPSARPVRAEAAAMSSSVRRSGRVRGRGARRRRAGRVSGPVAHPSRPRRIRRERGQRGGVLGRRRRDFAECVREDRCNGVGTGDADLLDHVGARQERLVDAGEWLVVATNVTFGEVLRDVIDAREDRVRRAMDVDWVRLERRAGAATAIDSTSSSSTTIGRPRRARSGSVRSKSRATDRWLSPRSCDGNACGLMSTNSSGPPSSARAA